MTDRLSALGRASKSLATKSRDVTVMGQVCEAGTNHLRIEGISQFAMAGDLVSIADRGGSDMAEVVQIDAASVLAIPYQKRGNIRLGATATLVGRLRVYPHRCWLGRVVDPLGTPLDDAGHMERGPEAIEIDRDPPRALDRNRVLTPIHTGIKAIDAFMPICAGQRIGIFAGTGVGKSTLLSMFSQVPDISVVVLALVGERGREVREFLEDILGTRRDRVVAIVSTGDDSAALRRNAPKTAMSVAEYFRDRGERVLLMIDSVTRLAHAQREYALSAGEPAVARGYPPSVFAEIAKLLERAGPGPLGTGDITMIATVLVDGDNHNDPVADAARGILDGHIVLDRKIAASGRWPAIDLLASLSRLAPKAWSASEQRVVQTARAAIANFEDTRDLRMIGGYQPGSDPDLDRAITVTPKIYELIQQKPDEIESGDIIAQISGVLKR
ncbi:MAG: FliI/YscN family ATPase [Hyphomicrobium sp.]